MHKSGLSSSIDCKDLACKYLRSQRHAGTSQTFPIPGPGTPPARCLGGGGTLHRILDGQLDPAEGCQHEKRMASTLRYARTGPRVLEHEVTCSLTGVQIGARTGLPATVASWGPEQDSSPTPPPTAPSRHSGNLPSDPVPPAARRAHITFQGVGADSQYRKRFKLCHNPIELC